MKWALIAVFSIIILIAPLVSYAGECGDVDNNGSVSILDITYLISYLYMGGPPPYSIDMSDVNNDGGLNILDITRLVNYLYLGGQQPTCGCGILTDIDGNTYKTIVIGDQCWMAENLEVTHYRNGDNIPRVTDPDTWRYLTTGARCEYDDNPAFVPVYGRLYNWYAMIDTRNIAPEGWHVPSDAEWKQLEMYLGMSQEEADQEGGYRGTDEGGRLKDAGFLYWYSPNTGATNETGFTGLPGGYRSNGGSYATLYSSGLFWTSTEALSISAWFRHLYYKSAGVSRDDLNKECGFSVRCVKD